MNKNIENQLSHFENITLKWLEEDAGSMIKKYEEIKQSCGLKEIFTALAEKGFGGAGLCLARVKETFTPIAASAVTPTAASSTLALTGPTASSTLALTGPVTTSLATTGTTALTTTGMTSAAAAGTTSAAAAGTAAASGGVLPIILPCLFAAVGGLIFGKGIGDAACTAVDILKAKNQLEELEKNANRLNTYCKNMSDDLFEVSSELLKAKSEVEFALKKIKNQDYKTQKNNEKRIKYRIAELNAIQQDVAKLMSKITLVQMNLAKLI